MTPAEELQKFREEQPLRVERARKVALRFGILATTTSMMFVYAFFQHTAANRNTMEIKSQMKKAIDSLRLVEKRATMAEVFEKNQFELLRMKKEECQKKTKAGR